MAGDRTSGGEISGDRGGPAGSGIADDPPGADRAAAAETDAPGPADAVPPAPPATPLAAGSTGAGGPGPVLGYETPAVLAPPPDYSQAGVPSLDFVRDKIEGRYAKSLGSTELAQETPEARSFEEQAAKRAEAAAEKLDAIRRSLRGDSST